MHIGNSKSWSVNQDHVRGTRCQVRSYYMHQQLNPYYEIILPSQSFKYDATFSVSLLRL